LTPTNGSDPSRIAGGICAGERVEQVPELREVRDKRATLDTKGTASHDHQRRHVVLYSRDTDGMAAPNWIGKNVLNGRLYRSLVNARNPRISAHVAVLARLVPTLKKTN
jgi:hypothetical protein